MPSFKLFHVGNDLSLLFDGGAPSAQGIQVSFTLTDGLDANATPQTPLKIIKYLIKYHMKQ